MTCVDLQGRFGRRYRIGWEADGATRAQWPRGEWPWLMEIRGRYGVVYPVGGELLAALTNRRGIASKLRALPCVLTAKGDIETVVTFHVDDGEQIFALLRPYRRRRVSDAERDRLRALSALHGFSRKDRQRITESERGDLESTIGSENEPAHGRVEVRTKAP